MPIKPFSINLLKNKETDFWSGFLKWASTLGRIVVIITFLIALSAFLYRFSLDRKLIDIRNEIKQKQTIVAGQRENETKYRNLQDRIRLASNFSNLGIEKHKILTDILGLTPQGLSLNALSLDSNKITIDARLNDVSSLSLFIYHLKNYPSIHSLSISSIENLPQTNFITVHISAELKESEFAIERPSNDEFNSTLTPSREGEVTP